MIVYKDFLEENPSETETRSYLVDGEHIYISPHLPGTLQGMSFSAFARTCMIEELAKRGA